MVWPTLGSKTTKEQDRTVVEILYEAAAAAAAAAAADDDDDGVWLYLFVSTD